MCRGGRSAVGHRRELSRAQVNSEAEEKRTSSSASSTVTEAWGRCSTDSTWSVMLGREKQLAPCVVAHRRSEHRRSTRREAKSAVSRVSAGRVRIRCTEDTHQNQMKEFRTTMGMQQNLCCAAEKCCRSQTPQPRRRLTTFA